ncbi:hypothetical protein JAAARDRAFT_192614 [Jaapia argillacea MUCL 33604]|uniref:Endonuclease/exonuclease/phosphatase domain-containing protein n=1 Tax=Jaapia argillacea MUCL 33604 TaxID=933084 RepID=A0A067Q8Y1_9AGAM|nr:hypothetical protein JAAARDRAFT_192614 [Jaapia argillacea MUCL 33604]
MIRRLSTTIFLLTSFLILILLKLSLATTQQYPKNDPTQLLYTTSSSQAPNSSVGALPIRLITHNIRYATAYPSRGELPWYQRRTHLISELLYQTRFIPTSIICLQEVLHNQLLDVSSSLGGQWENVGVGRDDGKQAGEYSPIFFRRDVWELVGSESLWLSETPEKPSKGWGAGQPRILTVVVLKHRFEGRTIVVMNTHLDDQSSRARQESANLILRIAREYASGTRGTVAPGTPLFLAGDFNSEMEEEAYGVLARGGLIDLGVRVWGGRRYGHVNTYTGFWEGEREKRIDFLWLGPGAEVDGARGEEGERSWDKELEGESERVQESLGEEGARWKVIIEGYAVLESRFEDGVYNSDHRAVVGDLLLL